MIAKHEHATNYGLEIDLVDATVVYPNRTISINGVNLCIKPGEFLTIVGRNGSGKSTLIKAILGECGLSSGAVWIGDDEVTKLPQHIRARSLAYVSQRPGACLLRGMTVEENCSVSLLKHSRLSLRGWSKDKQKSEIRDAIKALNLPLENKENVYVNELSGGEQQMVSLLVCYLQKAPVLLLDEHTASLDPTQRSEVLRVTRALFESSRATTIMVTHSLREALEMSDRILVLEGGKVKRILSGFFKKLTTEEDMYNEYFA